MESSGKKQQPTTEPTHYLVEEEYTVEVQLVRPKSLFLQFLREAGAAGEIFTKKEICTILKDYIGSRRLYDEHNPRVVHCSTDFLGAVLGVDSFTIDDVLNLLEKNITYVPDTCIKKKTHLVKKAFPVATSQVKSDETGGVSTITCKSSTSSSHDTEDVSSTENGCTENSTVSLSSGPSLKPAVNDRKKRKRNKKRKNKESCKSLCSEQKKRKRHSTDPQKQDSPQPGSSRRRGTSLSITYGDSGIGDCPFLQVELDDDDDDDEEKVGSTFSGIPVDDMWYINEGSLTFEVESEPHFSESDISSVRSGEELLVVCKESDVEFFADYSDSDSNSDDKELTEADNWTCIDCNLSNPPYQRFCNKCWKMRPDWLPNRRMPSDTETSQSKEGKTVEMNSKLYERVKRLKADCIETPDSGVGSLSCLSSSQESGIQYSSLKMDTSCEDSISSTQKKIEGYLSAADLLADSQSYEVRHSFSNFQSKGSSSASSIDSSYSQPEGQGQDLMKVKSSPLDDPCIICLTKPKAASLIHGSSGHQVCCFSCAKRLKRRGKVCPVCRRPIQKVVKNYIL